MYGRTYYTATQWVLTPGLWPHALHAITCWYFMIAKNQRRQTDRYTERQTDIYRYRQTYKINWTPLGSSRPQWGINAPQLWTPTLEMNTNAKIAKVPWTTKWADGRTDEQRYYTATQGIWPRGLWTHALRSITGHTNDFQKSMRTTKHRDIETHGRTYRQTDRQTDGCKDRSICKLNWNPLGSSGIQCGDKFLL